MDEYTDIINIKPDMLVFVPSAFTPDGDGLNDLWGPVLTNIDENDYRLTVFNRYGEVVFSTTDPNQKWNGSHNGDDYFVKSEVYVWMIETKNPISLEEVNFQGQVTVIR
jgi:gliding motility-associated-like protein